MSKQKSDTEARVNNAPAVQETKSVQTAVPNNTYNPEDWGQENLTSKDIIIPRILLMQPMSPQVTEEQSAVFGEFRESLNNDKLGDFKEGFEVVPFYMQKVFVEYKLDPPKKAGAKPEKSWLRTIPITPENENLKFEDEVTLPDTGELIQVARDRVMNFYVLLVKELELGGAIPHIISFRKTSITAGKKLTTQMYMKNINSGKSPASMVMEVFSKKESKTIDGTNATWAVSDVKPTRLAKDEWVGEAFRWLQLVKDGKAKVHDDSYAKEGTSSEIEVGNADATGTGKF